MRETKYTGKYFSVLGDSISTFLGYNPPDCAVYYDWEHKCLAEIYTPADTWWGKVINALDGKLLVNNSFSGSTVSKLPCFEIESYGCGDTRTSALGIGTLSPDVIIVLLGINDWGHGATPFSDDDGDGPDNFSVAYRTMLSKLKRNYPNAEIWCLTLPRSHWSANPDFVPPQCFKGHHFGDYCQAIRKCAKSADCRLIDIYDPENTYDTIDGFHPNAHGMLTIANAVLSHLEGGDTDDN